MLPEYKAIAVDQEAIETGSTKPCLMTVQDEAGKIIGDFVVKVFKPSNLEQGQNTNKEFYGNILAREFDLQVPDAALVFVDTPLISQLNKSAKYKDFNLEKGIYYGSEYIENALNYSSDLTLDFADWELETIFAFDVLIRNIDRRKDKPNLFVKNQELFLIDHELSLNITEDLTGDIFENKDKYWRFVDNTLINRKHLFLEALRDKNNEKSLNFDTFNEHLHRLNLNALSEVGTQLETNGLDINDLALITAYMANVKSNQTQFIALLKELVK